MDSSPPQLRISVDAQESLGSIVRRLLDLAEREERVSTRYLYRESVLRYLTGAQLEITLGNQTPLLPHELMRYWAWNEDCSAKYYQGNSITVVCGTPGEPLLRQLQQLRSLGWMANVITREDKVEAISDMLAEAGLLTSVGVMSLHMVIFSSMLRRGRGKVESIESGLADLFAMYNQIVEKVGAPQNLLIEMQFTSQMDRVQEIEQR